MWSLLVVVAYPQEWLSKTYGPQDGMLSGDVRIVFQDCKKMIWYGSPVGIGSFNGCEFENYTFDSENQALGKVTDIFEDRKEGLWMTSQRGLFHFKDGKWTTVLKLKTTLTTGVFDLYGDLILGTEIGLFRIRSEDIGNFLEEKARKIIPNSILGENLKYLEDSRINSVSISSKNEVYFSTNFLVAKVKGSDFETLWIKCGNRPDILDIEVLENDDIFWASENLNLGRRKTNDTLYNYPEILNPFDIIYRDSILYSLNATDVTMVNTQSNESMSLGLPVGTWPRQMIIDHENNFWIGSATWLTKTRKPQFTTYKIEGLNQIYSLCEVHDQVLAGGNRGRLMMVQEDSLIDHSNDRLFERAEIFAIHAGDSGIWFGSGYQGIVLKEGDSIVRLDRSNGMSDNTKYCFLETEEGTLTGGDGGFDLIKRELDDFTFKRILYETGDDSYVSFYDAVNLPSGRVLAASSEGLMIIEEDGLVKISIKNFPITNLRTTHLMIRPDSSIWVSTMENGILVCKESFRFNIEFVDQIDEEDGLLSQSVLDLVEDGIGNVWSGHYKGLCQISYDQGSIKVWKYNRSDGFPHAAFTNMSLLVSADEKLWCGTNVGLSSMEIDGLSGSSIQSDIYVSGFEILGEEGMINRLSDGSKSDPTMEQTAKIPYRYNDLEISYRVNTYQQPCSSNFRYVLSGHSNDWVYTEENKVTFQNLSGGKYSFQVQCQDDEGEWLNNEATLLFFVKKPFYQTIWFFILMGLFFLGSIRELLNRAKKKKKETALNNSIQLFKQYKYVYEQPLESICQDLEEILRTNLKSKHILVELSQDQGKTGLTTVQWAKRFSKKFSEDDLKEPRVLTIELVGIDKNEEAYVHTLMELAIQKLESLVILKKKKEAENSLFLVNSELSELKLAALRSQMNPHFIFNSLNSINWFILKNKKEEAQNYISKFSKLIRSVLNYSQESTIPLAKEIELLETYVFLENERRAKKFKFEVFIEDSLLDEDMFVPPLIFQPFIENAIWHGLPEHIENPTLKMILKDNTEELICIIEDNGVGREASYKSKASHGAAHQSKGVGLSDSRLSLLYPEVREKLRIQITDLYHENGSAAGTRIRISIPF